MTGYRKETFKAATCAENGYRLLTQRKWWPYQSMVSKLLTIAYLNALRPTARSIEQVEDVLTPFGFHMWWNVPWPDGIAHGISDGTSVQREIRSDLFEVARFRVCPKCLLSLYHSNIFQLRSLERCPLHECSLEFLSFEEGSFVRLPSGIKQGLWLFNSLVPKTGRLERRVMIEHARDELSCSSALLRLRLASFAIKILRLRDVYRACEIRDDYGASAMVHHRTRNLLVRRIGEQITGFSPNLPVAEVYLSMLRTAVDPCHSSKAFYVRSILDHDVTDDALAAADAVLRAQLAHVSTVMTDTLQDTPPPYYEGDIRDIEPYAYSYRLFRQYFGTNKGRRMFYARGLSLIHWWQGFLGDRTIYFRGLRIMFINVYWAIFQWVCDMIQMRGPLQHFERFEVADWLMVWQIRESGGGARVIVASRQFWFRHDSSAIALRDSQSVLRRAERVRILVRGRAGKVSRQTGLRPTKPLWGDENYTELSIFRVPSFKI